MTWSPKIKYVEGPQKKYVGGGSCKPEWNGHLT